MNENGLLFLEVLVNIGIIIDKLWIGLDGVHLNSVFISDDRNINYKILYRAYIHKQGTGSQSTIYQKGIRYLGSPIIQRTRYLPSITNLAKLTGGFERPKYVFAMYGIYMPERIAMRSRNKFYQIHIPA